MSELSESVDFPHYNDPTSAARGKRHFFKFVETQICHFTLNTNHSFDFNNTASQNIDTTYFQPLRNALFNGTNPSLFAQITSFAPACAPEAVENRDVSRLLPIYKKRNPRPKMLSGGSNGSPENGGVWPLSRPTDYRVMTNGVRPFAWPAASVSTTT